MEARTAARATRRLVGPSGSLGAVLSVAGIVVIILNVALPWILVDPSGTMGGFVFARDTLDRDDLKDGPFDYLTQLVEWALIGQIVAILGGVALMAVAVAPGLNGRAALALRAVAAVVAAYGSFLVALTGFRWLGVLIENVTAPGDPLLTLHAVPYVNLGYGVLGVLGSAWLLRRAFGTIREGSPHGRLSSTAWRVPLASVVVAAVALLVLPLVPYTVTESPSGDRYQGENTYAMLAQYDARGDRGGDVGRDLGWARLMLWFVGYASLAAAAAALLEREGHDFLTWGTLAQVYVLNAIPLVTGAVFVILSYVHLAQLDDVTIAFNHVLPLAYATLFVVACVWVRRVLQDYTRHVELTSAEEGPPNTD